MAARAPPSVGGHGGHHGAAAPSDPAAYASLPFHALASRRVGWLAAFLCSLSLTAVIMDYFEETLH